MKGTNGQVQTVSIIDTISELATNQGDRAKITQVSTGPSKTTRINTSSTSSSPSKAGFSSLSLSSGSRYQPPPPGLTPPSKFLATNINISQMSLPVSRFNSGKVAASNNSSVSMNTNFEEFSSGLDSSGFLSSTLAVPERPLVKDSRRKARGRKIKRSLEVRGQGETPDWIRQLFGFAKKGNLERLKSAVADMERTMIRNLSDHLGNNLLHVISRHGLVHLLPWLAGRLGPELNSALSDENKQGLTPVVLAIKYGRQDTVRWLVENTRDRERLASRDGERSLLHMAARYGQDCIAGWLSEEMSQDGLEVDQLDLSGNTPLHLAARNGNTKTASTLLNFGARVNVKNDMGLKPSDCSTLRGKESTAEFLVMFETSLGITKELLQKEKLQEQLLAESSEMKTNFKDVVSVSKKLAKEREEMCRDLSRLHESMIELHDKMIMQIQILAQENSSLKKNGLKDSSVNIAGSIAECDGLHERWQAHQAQYFSSSLADLEHRILLAEDNIKKHRPGPAPPDQSYAHRSLRDRLEEMRASSSSLSGARPLSQTCSSDTATSPEESGEELNDTADSNFYEAMRTPSSSRAGYNIAQRKKLATPSPIKTREALNESMYSSLSSPLYSTIGSQELKGEPGLDYNSAKVAASELARAGVGLGQSPIRLSGGKEDRRRSRSDLKKRLKQLALTSETGSASVIEVIEPNSSEEEEFKKSLQEMNISWGKSLSVHQAEPQAPAMTPVVRSRRLTAEPQARPERPEKEPKNGPTSEPSIPNGVSNVGQDNSEDSITPDTEQVMDDEAEELYSEDFSDIQLLSYDIDSERCDSSLQMKKKGFLQKLSISKWAQKKRSGKGSSGKAKELAPEYFRETYISPRTEGLELAGESGVTRISVGQEEADQADLHNRLSKSLSPATRKSGHPQYDKGLTVATSDDSGIIARPLSSASKSETSLSRPDSSSSDPPARQETSLSVSVSSGQPSTTIITLDTNNINNNTKQVGPVVKNKSRSKKKEEKPWYDVSDEDVEIPTPEHITSIISVRGSSDEDTF